VESADAASELARRVRRAMGQNGSVFEGGFAAQGARVWTP
jgi:hypothetical protein